MYAEARLLLRRPPTITAAIAYPLALAGARAPACRCSALNTAPLLPSFAVVSLTASGRGQARALACSVLMRPTKCANRSSCGATSCPRPAAPAPAPA